MTLCTSLMKRTSWPMKIWIVLLLSTLKLLQSSDRSTRNGITIPYPLKSRRAFPVTINKTVLLMRSMTLISFWTRKVYGTWLQQLLCHSTTLMIDTLCPINTLKQQLNNLEQTHIRCFIHREGWTKNDGIAHHLCILLTKLPTRLPSERNSCYGWRVEWSPKTRTNEWNSAICDEL